MVVNAATAKQTTLSSSRLPQNAMSMRRRDAAAVGKLTGECYRSGSKRLQVNDARFSAHNLKLCCGETEFG
jgi:hypothetical protein